jgi:ABC-type polysaccharide/polyol phosphate transport system ATPase subunit
LSPVEGSKINIQGKFVPIIEPWGLAEITDSLENNIILIGLILGFKKNDIKRNLVKILEFSDLEDKKIYQFSSLSTGMKLRLVFAIVFIMGSQIFFMDEFLTTGDEKFRNKVIKHLNDISQDIITVICSHERKLIQDFCNKILVLDKGEQIYFGEIDKGFEIYNNLANSNI